MGMIKGGLLIVVSVLLFLSLIASGSLYILQSSLDYEDIGPRVGDYIQNKADAENSLIKEVNSNFSILEEHCKENSEYVLKSQELFKDLVIPCNVVSQGPEEVIIYGVNQTVSEAYYKEYDCGFFECLTESENRLFFVSQQSQDYLKSKFYWSVLISLILISIIFIFSENKSNFPITLGIVFILSSFIFINFSYLVSWFVESEIYQIIEVLLVSSSYVFLFYLFFGIILIGAGVGFRFWDFGNSVGKFFKKDSVK